jgi:hypothetical protein
MGLNAPGFIEHYCIIPCCLGALAGKISNSNSIGLYFQLAEFSQCYCREIRQMLTFRTDFYCPKALHRLNHSIRIVESHRKKIIPKPNIFTRSRNQDRFWTCDLCSCNLVAGKNNFCLGAILLSCLVSKLQKHFHRDSNPEQIFVVVVFVPPRSNKQFWSWRCSSVVLCIRATETTLTGTRTQDNVSEFWPF